MKKLLFVIVVVTIAGCKQKSDVPETNNIDTKKQEEVEKTSEKPPYTELDWRRDFLSTFKETGVKVNDDGMKNYDACFDEVQDSKKCIENFSSYRDGFKKVDYMTPVITSFYGIADLKSMINMYIAAIECREAKAVLQPSFNGKNGWLFMNKVAFMADGEIVFEKSTDRADVKRDNEYDWVHEKWTFPLSNEDQKNLLKFSESKSRIIRITGDKGYVTIGKSELDAFTKDIKSLIKNTNKINQVMSAAGGPSCTNKQHQQS